MKNRGNKPIQAAVKLIIDAPIDKVWDVLTETKKYTEWNPFVYQVVADKEKPTEGCKMTFSVRFDDGKETKSKEIVTNYKAPEESAGTKAIWEYRFAGFFHSIGMIRAIRTQSLNTLPNGKTEYASIEIFTG